MLEGAQREAGWLRKAKESEGVVSSVCAHSVRQCCHMIRILLSGLGSHEREGDRSQEESHGDGCFFALVVAPIGKEK